MKTGLILLGSFIAISLIFSICYLLWLNRESEKLLSLFLTLLGPILVSVFLFLFEFSSPLPGESKDVDILLIYSFDKQIDQNHILIPNLSNPLSQVDSERSSFQTLLIHAIYSSPPIQEESNNDHLGSLGGVNGKYLFSLMEKTLWQWLWERYPAHWEMEYESFNGVGMKGGGFYAKRGAEEEPKIITSNEFEKLLISNVAFDAERKMFGDLALPSGSTLSFVNKSEIWDQIIIENPHGTFVIDIQLRGAGTLQNFGIIAKLITSLDAGRSQWYTSNYNVRFKAQYSKLYRWSPKTRKLKDWFQEMSQSFEQTFSWELMRSDLEKFIALGGEI